MSEYYPHNGEKAKESADKKTEKDSKYESKEKIGKSITKELLTPPSEIPREKKVESLWQRFANISEKKELDRTLIRPIENADNDTKLAMPSAAKIETDTRRLDSPEIVDEALEILDTEELQEVVRQYADARKEQLDSRLKERPEGQPVPAETVADKTFLQALESQLQESDNESIDDILDKAETATVQVIEESTQPARSDETAEHYQGEIDLRHNPDDDDKDEDTVIFSATTSPTSQGPIAPPTAAGSGGSGNGGNTPPPQPPTPPIPPVSPGGPQPPSGGASRGYPSRGYASWSYAAPGVAHNQAPSYPLYTLHQVHVQERRALAQGLLLGGIIGYFIGRRRGRIKTEKRLLPIQKKLEKQTIDLQAKILEREQRIQLLAAEKARLMRSEQQRRFIESLEQYATVQKNQTEVTGKPAESLHQTESSLAIAAGAVIAGRRKKEIAAAANTNRSKKVEDYTTNELEQAAEKIFVENVSLREIWTNHRLSQKQVGRIVDSYITGGSVREALNKELFDEPIRYEKDPMYRNQHQSSSSRAGQTGAAAAAAALLHQDIQTAQPMAESWQPPKNAQANTPKKSVSNSKKYIAAGGAAVGILAILMILL